MIAIALKRTVIKDAIHREAVVWCKIAICQFMKITSELGG